MNTTHLLYIWAPVLILNSMEGLGLVVTHDTKHKRCFCMLPCTFTLFVYEYLKPIKYHTINGLLYPI